MSWNVVLNKFIEIKNKAIDAGIDLWGYDKDSETCLENWIRMLNEAEYIELISSLQLNEYGDLLLVRYGNYSNVFGGESEATFDTFWDLYDGFYRECRSVVINIKKDELVLVPFRKFRNLNEGEETSYENIQKRMKTAKCIEFSNKLDGSMQSARFYDGEFVMAGSQSLDRENSWRLADGYRMLTENDNYLNMLIEHADKTFIFEYISARDAHVVKYDTEGLFLIGIRDVNTGEEASYKEVLDYAARYGTLTTEVFDKTLDQVISELDDKKSSEAEGFVVNIDGYKVKIKYNDYVYMHKMLSAISSINLIIQNIADDRFDDLIAKVPLAYRNRVMNIADIVFKYKNETENMINETYAKAPKDDKKEFMIWVSENADIRIQGYLRNKYLGKGYNVLKRQSSYLKLKDMGVDDYEYTIEE